MVLFLLLVAILVWWIVYKFTIYALPCPVWQESQRGSLRSRQVRVG